MLTEMIFLNTLFFIFFFLIFPVRIIFDLIGIKSSQDVLIDLGLSLTCGIVFLSLTGVVVRILGLGYSSLWFIPAVSLVYIAFRIKKIRNNILVLLNKKNINIQKTGIVLIILVMVILQNIVLYRGGWRIAGGFIFPSPHDTFWNIALTNELYHNFPPQHPTVAGELLKNNHYFYPLFLAIWRSISHVNTFDLYYRIGPVLISLLFGLNLYAISTIFTKNIIFKGLTVFIGFFSGSFAYFLPFLLDPGFDWKGNTFFADQPFDQLINPYTVFGFSILIMSIFSLYQSLGKKTIHIGWTLVFSLLSGSLYGFKSFGGIIAVSAIFFTSFYAAFFYRIRTILLHLFLSSLIFLPVFFLITDTSKSSLHWMPGWLLTEIMTGKDKLNLPIFAQIEDHYRFINNRLGFMKIKTIEFITYLTGNLGTRLLGLGYLLILIIKKENNIKLRMKMTYVYMFFCVFVALLIPLFFNLGGNAYNIVQFTPYALVVLAILTVIAMEKIAGILISKDAKVTVVISVLILIILTVPVNIKNVLTKINNPIDTIDNSEIEALEFLSNHSDVNARILIDPDQFSLDPVYIPALSGRRLYMGSSGYAIQTGNDYRVRMKGLKIFFDNYSDKTFLVNNRISYIYLLKKNYNTAAMDEVFHGKLNISTFFENNRVVIYKV